MAEEIVDGGFLKRLEQQVGVHAVPHQYILKHDYALTYLDHPGNRPTGDPDELGATAVPSIAEVAQRSDVVPICVTGSPQVEEIVLGDGGLASVIEAGKIVVDLSTVEPATTERVHAAIRDKGVTYMDIPMTRTPKEAEAGKLNLLAGGDESTLETLRPLLSTFPTCLMVKAIVRHGRCKPGLIPKQQSGNNDTSSSLKTTTQSGSINPKTGGSIRVKNDTEQMGVSVRLFPIPGTDSQGNPAPHRITSRLLAIACINLEHASSRVDISTTIARPG